MLIRYTDHTGTRHIERVSHALGALLLAKGLATLATREEYMAHPAQRVP